MKLTLHPYTQTVKQGDTLFFLGRRPEDTRGCRFTEEQTALLQRLAEGAFLPEEEIRAGLTDAVTEELLRLGHLTEETVDTTSMDSRTAAFCAIHGMADAPERLRKKSVMILGCGGIGTHMAWHMVALGVGTLILVDFDVVEESNLNRQILFDQEDIGAVKAEVLREKLLRIRPEADIRVMRCRVDSQETLARLVTGAPCDLLVKALDSPAAFPVWLDAVCKAHQIPYVAGITLQDRILIGPTFLPGESEIGWSDLLPVQGGAEKLWGTSPSMGLLLYRIADALAIESFKVLTGHGRLSYAGCILAENVFTNEAEWIGHREAEPEERPEPKQSETPNQPSREGAVLSGSAVTTVMTFLLAVLGVTAFRPLLFSAFLMGAIFPLFTCRRDEAPAKAAFANTLLVMLCVLLNGVLHLAPGSLGQRLAALVPYLLLTSVLPLASAAAVMGFGRKNR